MTEEDDMLPRAKALFAAARRETPAAGVRERTLRAMRAAPRVGDGRSASGSQYRDWTSGFGRRATYAAVALAVLALTTFMIIEARRDVELSLSPERTLVARRVPAPESSVSAPAALSAAVPDDPKRTIPAPKRARSSPEAPAPAPSAAVPRAPVSLSEEVAALDRARTALARGDASQAMRDLDEYDGVLQGARLAEEATLLRIDVLKQLGHVGVATELARKFIRANPGSPLAERARAFVEANSASLRVGGSDAGGSR